MNKMPTSVSSRVGGYRNPPDIMSWPRGSKHRPVRIQSNRARKSCRRADIESPFNNGAPPTIRRTGFPAVWPAMQRSEERRVGKGGVRTGGSRWSQYHYKKNNNNKRNTTTL